MSWRARLTPTGLVALLLLMAGCTSDGATGPDDPAYDRRRMTG